MNLGMEIGLDPGHIVLDGDPAPLQKGGTVPPIFRPCLLWPNGWMDQDATWYGGRPLRRPHCVRWEPSSPPRGTAAPSPEFSAHVCCAQTAGWIKMRLMEVGLGLGHIVWGPSPPSKGHSPQFSALVCCGQTAGWIKMPLGTEVDLGLGHIVLDGDPAPTEMGTAAPSFDPILLWTMLRWCLRSKLTAI